MHRRKLRAAAVIKTNQGAGAWSGALARRISGRPLVVRCGYLWSSLHERTGSPAWKRGLVRALEGGAMRAADRVVVSTE